MPFPVPRALFVSLALLAPYLPHVTDSLYRSLYQQDSGKPSIHVCRWPEADDSLLDAEAESHGDTLVGIATAVRRYKSGHGLAMGAGLALLDLATSDALLAQTIRTAQGDLCSVTRAPYCCRGCPHSRLVPLPAAGGITVGVVP